MYAKGNGLASYSQVANMETDPIRQIVMLYKGAMRFLRLTADDIEAHNMMMKADHSQRALDIILYLRSILNFEQGGEVAKVYDTFYENLTTMVIRASSGLDAPTMRRAAELINGVCEAWEVNAKAGIGQIETARLVAR